MTDKKTPGEKLLYCSFCGKSQHEVRKLIAGPSVFICDECIELCNDIIRDEIAADHGGKGAKGDLPTPIPETQPLSDERKKYIHDIAKVCEKVYGPLRQL